MLKTPTVTITLPPDKESFARRREASKKSGKLNSVAHMSEAGKASWEARKNPKPGRIPFNKAWMFRKKWKGTPVEKQAQKLAAEIAALNPPAPLNPEIRCMAQCGFTMIASNAVRDMLTKNRAFEFTCPKCDSVTRCTKRRYTGSLAGLFKVDLNLIKKAR